MTSSQEEQNPNLPTEENGGSKIPTQSEEVLKQLAEGVQLQEAVKTLLSQPTEELSQPTEEPKSQETTAEEDTSTVSTSHIETQIFEQSLDRVQALLDNNNYAKETEFRQKIEEIKQLVNFEIGLKIDQVISSYYQNEIYRLKVRTPEDEDIFYDTKFYGSGSTAYKSIDLKAVKYGWDKAEEQKAEEPKKEELKKEESKKEEPMLHQIPDPAIKIEKGHDAIRAFKEAKNHFEKTEPAEPAFQGLVPEHSHANNSKNWKTKWGKTFRICTVCGLKQWSLQCWTNYRWTPKAPVKKINDYRDDITDDINKEGINGIWTEKAHRLRSWDIIPEAILNTPITVIGAGSIGSFTVMCLNKMGFDDLLVYDDDQVTPENIGTQIYGDAYSEKDMTKVNALQQILKNSIGTKGVSKLKINSNMFPTHSHEEYNRGGILISAVDSMAARKRIWSAVKANKKIELFIDARMGGETAQMYSMKPYKKEDRKAFAKTLYSDKEAVQEPCTRKATVYTAFLIAGMIGKAVKDVLTNSPYPRVMYWNIADNVQQVFHNQD